MLQQKPRSPSTIKEDIVMEEEKQEGGAPDAGIAGPVEAEKKPRLKFAATVFFVALVFLLAAFSFSPSAIFASMAGLACLVLAAVDDRRALFYCTVAAVNLLFLIASMSIPSLAAFAADPSNLSFATDFFTGLSPFLLTTLLFTAFSLFSLWSLVSLFKCKPEGEGEKKIFYGLFAANLMAVIAAIGIASIGLAASPTFSAIQIAIATLPALFSLGRMGFLRIQKLQSEKVLASTPEEDYLLGVEARLGKALPVPGLPGLVMQYLGKRVYCRPFVLNAKNIPTAGKALAKVGKIFVSRCLNDGRLYCTPYSQKDYASLAGLYQLLLDLPRSGDVFFNGQEVNMKDKYAHDKRDKIGNMIGALRKAQRAKRCENREVRIGEILDEYVALLCGKENASIPPAHIPPAQKKHLRAGMFCYGQHVQEMKTLNIFGSLLNAYPKVQTFLSSLSAAEYEDQILPAFTSPSAMDEKTDLSLHIDLSDEGLSLKFIYSNYLNVFIRGALSFLDKKSSDNLCFRDGTQMLETELVLKLSQVGTQQVLEVVSVEYKGGSPLLNRLLDRLVMGGSEEEILRIFKKALSPSPSPSPSPSFTF
jgi:hypothetical protein